MVKKAIIVSMKYIESSMKSVSEIPVPRNEVIRASKCWHGASARLPDAPH